MTTDTTGSAMPPCLPSSLGAFYIFLLHFTEAPACLVLLHCFLGFLCGFLLLLTISFATGGGIRGGDIKLAAILGIPFGASGLMTVLAVSCILILLHMGIKRRLEEPDPMEEGMCKITCRKLNPTRLIS